MKSKIHFIISLFFALTFLISCGDDQDEKFYYNIDNSLARWISPFGDKTTFLYYNEKGEATSVDVSFFMEETPVNWLDCQRDGGTRQCEYRFATLEFNSIPDTTVVLSVLLLGENHMRVMPNKGGISEDICRLDEDVNEFRFNEKYNASYIEDFNYKNQTEKAFVVENLIEDFTNYFPPKSFTLVKNIGVTEWTDYRGEVWKLSN